MIFKSSYQTGIVNNNNQFPLLISLSHYLFLNIEYLLKLLLMEAIHNRLVIIQLIRSMQYFC